MANKLGSNKKLPLNQSIPLGIQHVFAMFAGNITVPLIVAGVFGVTTGEKIFLIQMALFAAGVATIIQTVEVTPALVVFDGLPVHELLEIDSSWRHDDLNLICEVCGEILGGQGRTGTQEDEGFTDRFQLGEYLFQFRERRVGTYVVEVVCVCEEVCVLMDHLESQTSQHLA